MVLNWESRLAMIDINRHHEVFMHLENALTVRRVVPRARVLLPSENSCFQRGMLYRK